MKKNKNKKQRPRLHVFRSNKHIYAQVIDDSKNKTVAASSSLCPMLKSSIESTSTCKTATLIGEDIANKLHIKGIKEIVFDRGNKVYHGRVKALAQATREAGIKF